VLQFWVDQQTAQLKGFEVVEVEGTASGSTSPNGRATGFADTIFKVEIPPGVKVHRQMLDLQEPFQR